MPPEPGAVDRREFVESLAAACASGLPLLLAAMRVPRVEAQQGTGASYDPAGHWYGMGIDVDKCIGCGRCVNACKTENDVPREPGAFNTWVERYVIRTDGEVVVDSPDGGIAGFPPVTSEVETRRTFFVPTLQPLRQAAVCSSLPGGRDLHHAGWRGAGGR